MYFQYGLYAAPAILISSVAAWLYLKISGRSGSKNNLILAAGTFIALAVAMLVPLIARVFVQNLSLSIFLSILFAFLLNSLVLGIGFALAGVLKGKSGKTDEPSDAAKDLTAELGASSEAAYDEPGDSGDAGEIKQKIVDTGRNTDKIGIEDGTQAENTIKILLGRALDCKMQGNFDKAVESYREILGYNPGKALAAQIITDMCGLLKRTGNREVIREILDSDEGNLLEYEIKSEIMNNI